MREQSSSASTGAGALVSREKMGVRALLMASVVALRILEMCALSQAMWRWGELPLARDGLLVQKGHVSMVFKEGGWREDVDRAFMWCSLYEELQRIVLV